mmetsp:Transcript_38601/g.111362  ORF Transcript_38601/g.111362 Transcript_38601/m.111362 type:complete len:282 (+) Transcript_38601:839-1684(+)
MPSLAQHTTGFKAVTSTHISLACPPFLCGHETIVFIRMPTSFCLGKPLAPCPPCAPPTPTPTSMACVVGRGIGVVLATVVGAMVVVRKVVDVVRVVVVCVAVFVVSVDVVVNVVVVAVWVTVLVVVVAVRVIVVVVTVVVVSVAVAVRLVEVLVTVVVVPVKVVVLAKVVVVVVGTNVVVVVTVEVGGRVVVGSRVVTERKTGKVGTTWGLAGTQLPSPPTQGKHERPAVGRAAAKRRRCVGTEPSNRTKKLDTSLKENVAPPLACRLSNTTLPSSSTRSC